MNTTEAIEELEALDMGDYPFRPEQILRILKLAQNESNDYSYQSLIKAVKDL